MALVIKGYGAGIISCDKGTTWMFVLKDFTGLIISHLLEVLERNQGLVPTLQHSAVPVQVPARAGRAYFAGWCLSLSHKGPSLLS